MLLPLGSGKTAVLVERIIHKVVDEGVDIDKILVVTFTNAAAAEMRERILDAIYKKLEQDPENARLQRQILLLNKASICTIHSFCLDVIRNNFYEIDTSANFRIADTAEIELLKNDVIEELFEEKYENEDKGFLSLIDTYTGYRGDEALIELVLNIYKYIQSSPFPLKWLEKKVNMFNIEETDFGKTIWGKYIIEQAKDTIYECMLQLEKAKNDTLKLPELESYTLFLEENINNLADIYNNMEDWDKAYEKIKSMDWGKWPINRKVTSDIKEEAKQIRESAKKQFNQIVINETSQDAISDIQVMYPILKELENLIKEFSIKFTEKKKEKNIIDFNDIEHFALNILVTEKDGKLEKTEVAKKYENKFVEIAVDEYQDSNLVQEYILNSISNEKNLFMVGDVKQSIYKFRQARPELFIEKYEAYETKPEQGKKIQLFKNFRSRQNILDLTNCIFANIMSKNLGDIDYTKDEFLNFGADYPVPDSEEKNYAGIAELHIIDLKDDETEDSEEADENEEERIENSVLEARFVTNKIKELIESRYQVYDKKVGYRKITYKDICVLLRATSNLAPIYEKEMIEQDIPVFSDTSSTYLDSMEVQIIMSLLKIIDNPMQDIPLVTVLRSNIGKFTDDELIQIRLADKKCSFYEAMLKARVVAEEPLKEKIESILNCLENWKKQKEYLALDEFIWNLYIETGFYHYVSLLNNGNLRQANLKLLFEKAKQYEKASYKGLFNFINFIDKVKISGDTGSAKIIGENENVVRIMSIHKSKGLEFPVVFLCATSKKMNMQDLNNPILLDQDIGFGVKRMDTKRRVEYNTFTKDAIRIKNKRESISEEMRVLYVALTRAKEKLIITGISKDLKKSLEKKESLLQIYQNEGNASKEINYKLVEKYVSYLDWIELCYLYSNMKDILTLKTHTKSEIVKQIQMKEEQTDIIEMIEQNKEAYNLPEKERQEIYEKLNYEYPYIESSKVPTKTSVTKLKERENIEEYNADIEDLVKDISKENVSLTAMPKFMEGQIKLTSAQKGTLMHLCVQKLDETKEYSKDDLKDFVDDLYKSNMISELEKNSVDIEALYNYTKSSLWQDLRQAKEIHKEKAFYITIPAQKINPKAQENETILVQGIIDLYYINKNDELILIDFKTDHIKDEKKLEEKYKVQLDLYKDALEQALHRKVNKASIYALS